MSSLQPVRGTHDLLPEEMRRHRRVIETAREIAERHGYLQMVTPVFEFTEVFKRTLGESPKEFRRRDAAERAHPFRFHGT